MTFALDNAWFVFVLFTVSHAYTALLLRQAVISLLLVGTPEECSKVYTDTVTSGGVFVRGMIPRTEIRNIGNHAVYIMDPKDPSAWLAHGAVILLFLAIIPFSYSGFFAFMGWTLLGLLLMCINWVFGSIWAVTLSKLENLPSTPEERLLVLCGLCGRAQVKLNTSTRGDS
jgi:hypothetical protein